MISRVGASRFGTRTNYALQNVGRADSVRPTELLMARGVGGPASPQRLALGECAYVATPVADGLLEDVSEPRSVGMNKG